MITTYFKSTNEQALISLRAAFVNVMPPRPGRAAYVDEEGIQHEAVGSPDYWYTSILAPLSIPAFGGIEPCNEVEGGAVCGSWA